MFSMNKNLTNDPHSTAVKLNTIENSYAKILLKIYVLHKEGKKLNQQLKTGCVTNTTGWTVQYDTDNKFENESTDIWKKTTLDSFIKIYNKEQELITKLNKFSTLTPAKRKEIEDDIRTVSEKEYNSEKGIIYINKIKLGK